MSTPSPWKFFTVEELTCHCGCGAMEMDEEFMGLLVALRRMSGVPLPLSSAYRCPKYNSEVSSTGLEGPHTTGQAVDPRISGVNALKVLQMAPLYGMTGIGVKQHGPYSERFIHLDNLFQIAGRPRPHIWSYS